MMDIEEISQPLGGEYLPDFGSFISLNDDSDDDNVSQRSEEIREKVTMRNMVRKKS